VIHLRFYVDDSLEGIAAALGCSVGTVKSRLFNALDKLRAMNALREQGIFSPGGRASSRAQIFPGARVREDARPPNHALL
jgi:hypothetical protein